MNETFLIVEIDWSTSKLEALDEYSTEREAIQEMEVLKKIYPLNKLYVIIGRN